MYRRMALTVVLVFSCAWCMTLVTRADSSQEALPDVYHPVASVEALMVGQAHFFKEIRKNLKTLNDPGAIHEIEEAAQVLAELANVNRYNKNKADYRQWATELRDTAMQLAGEADKKKNADLARMNNLVGSMKQTCGACHDAYQ